MEPVSYTHLSGAVRGGAGLVSLGVPEEIWPIAAVKCLEAMPFPLPARYEDILRRASSCEGVLIGPGLGRAPRTERLAVSYTHLDVYKRQPVRP